MRVLLDANILISFLLGNNPVSPIRRIVRAAVAGAYTLLLPAALTTELRRAVTASPYLAQRITSAELDELLTILESVAEPIATIDAPLPVITRDPKDDYLLAYAVVGQADYLVTGDLDLLALTGLVELAILRPAEFVLLLDHLDPPA